MTHNETTFIKKKCVNEKPEAMFAFFPSKEITG